MSARAQFNVPSAIISIIKGVLTQIFFFVDVFVFFLSQSYIYT